MRFLSHVGYNIDSLNFFSELICDKRMMVVVVVVVVVQGINAVIML
jgi:hypothetical protein